MRRTFKIMESNDDRHEVLFEGKAETPEPLPTGKALDALIKAVILPLVKTAAASDTDLKSALELMGSGMALGTVCLVLYDAEDDPSWQMPVGLDEHNGRLKLMAWEDDD